MSASTRNKISEAAKKQWREGRGPDRSDPAWKKKISIANSGRRHTPETIAKLKLFRPSPDQIAAVVFAHKGKPLSLAHRKKLSEALKGRTQSPAHVAAVKAARRAHKSLP